MEAVLRLKQRAAQAFKVVVSDNPIVVKEFRTRMRGIKAFTVIGSYVFILSLILVIFMFVYTEISRNMYRQTEIGTQLFNAMTWTQAILLGVLLPAIIAGTITSEVESKTIEMIAITRLTASRIVAGKHISGFLYGLILLICSLPLSGVTLMMGGISPAQIGVTYLMLAGWVFLLCCISVFWSSMTKQSAVAILFSYGTVFLYFIFFSSVAAGMYFSRGVAAKTAWAFSGLTPSMIGQTGLLKAEVCGVQIPAALISILFVAALGLMLLFIAVTHIQYKRSDKALPVRILLLFLTLLAIFAIIGDRTVSPIFNDLDVIFMIVGAALLLLIGLSTSTIATGPINKPEGTSSLAYIFSPSKTFKGDLGGSILFILLWTAAAYAAFGIAVSLSSAAYHVALKDVELFIDSNEKIMVGFWAAYLQIGISLLSFFFSAAAIGVLISTVSRFRAAAVATTVSYVLFTTLGVLLVLSIIDSAYDPSIYTPIWQIAILSPLTPMTVLMNMWSMRPHYLWPTEFTWLAVSLFHLTVGLIAILIARRNISRGGGIRGERL